MIFRKEWEFTLRHEVETALFSELLKEEDLPHRIVRHGDPTFGSIMEVSDDYAHVETSPEYEQRLREVYLAFREGSEILPDDEEPPEVR